MSEGKLTPQQRYDAKYKKQFILACFTSTEQDIIDKLNSVPNKNGYIKSLIRADIQREKEIKKMKKYSYFCATCGRRFESDLPYKDENGLESDVSCPHCGDFNVYPDTEDGHKREQKAFNDYENTVKAWEE